MRARKKLVRKSRDPQERREEARRFASKVSKIILAVVAAVALIVLANRWGASERLVSVRIIGRVVLDSAEIMERSGVDSHAALRSLDLREVESRIGSHPFLSRVAVYRDSHGTLVVEVTERTPVALCVLDGAPVYLDSQAVALPHRFSRSTLDVPVVRGVERVDKSTDGVNGVASKGGGSSRTLLDSIAALEALGVVRAVRDFDETLYRQISEIARDASSNYTFVTADGAITIRAGRADEIPSRLAKLELFMRTALASRAGARPKYIDLRWRGQVVVKWDGDEGPKDRI